MIHIKNLKKYYGKNLIINDVSFDVGQGEIFAIVGHSGAGKSTLLRCINGLESYQGGNLLVEGKEIKNLNDNELRHFRKNVGMIFQHFALMSRKNVFENVATPLRFWGYDESYINSRVSELLELVELGEKKSVYPASLSGGQKQRVAIARALALNPKILLSDEATSALDPKITKGVLELLAKINKEFGISIVLVTHEMEVVKKIANTAVLLDRGEVVSSGTTQDLFLKPDEKMRHFLGEDEILPTSGVNVKLYFPKEVAQNSVITTMARELDINFNIVWGKLEELGGIVLGNLVINIDEKDKEKVINFIEKSGVLWEIG
ncbi:MAG: methionine ABC transporter ATP-binding protein [Campylobacter sp.]|nr:methionine ABC transporter ATP-binding protein [Campylobacter sp.]